MIATHKQTNIHRAVTGRSSGDVPVIRITIGEGLVLSKWRRLADQYGWHLDPDFGKVALGRRRGIQTSGV